MTFYLRRWLSGLVTVLASGAFAETPAPVAGAGIVLQSIGVYFSPEIAGTEAAPDTELGYINLMTAPPEFIFRQTDVPARLGLSFGILIVADRDIANVRVLTWKPGATDPESWTTDIVAGEPKLRGFVFEYENELIPGPWRMEAYDGDTQLYSVTFEVLPGSELPSVTSNCDLLSSGGHEAGMRRA